MADTYTTRNRITKPEPGQYTNAWGPVLNANAFDMFDQAIDGRAAYSLSGTKTLSSANGSTDEARCRIQHITSGTGGTVTIPAVEKTYFVINDSSGTVYFTAGGAQASVPTGSNYWVMCDGTDCQAQTPVDYTAVVGTIGELLSSQSASSVAVGTGSKTFTVSASKAFSVGALVRVVSQADANNYMIGTVTSYSGTTLQITVATGDTGGSGTHTDWIISVTGQTGTDGSIANQQTFTSSGTWTKPTGTWSIALVEVWGAGGGGGSGRKGAAGSARGGGGGGGGGGYRYSYIEASSLGATETVTIGVGGSGGTLVSANDTNGNAGSAGGDTSFGSHVIGKGGSGGGAGLSSVNSGGAGGGIFSFGAGGNGAVGGSAIFGGGGGAGTIVNNPGLAGGGSMHGGGGGGAGGSISTIDSNYSGGAGGSQTATTGGGGSGGTSSSAPGTAAAYQGGGGGAGGSVTLAYRTASNGGRAGGGGGGGAGLNATADSGAGGTGGNGYCRVTLW